MGGPGELPPDSPYEVYDPNHTAADPGASADDHFDDLVDPVMLDGAVVPVRKWLVPGYIPWGAVTLLGGDGGVGKSLLCMQLQAAAALGQPWIGREITPVRSLGLYAEDDRGELHRRLVDIAALHGVDLPDIGDAMFAPRVGVDNILAKPDGNGGLGTTAVYGGLMARCVGLGAQLLVIDTVADTYGANENWRAEVRAFINMLRRLAIAIDGAVVLTAHPSQAGLATGTGISGSTAWHNTVRSRLYLTRPGDDDGDGQDRLLKGMKANYGPVPDELRLRWEDGVFVNQDVAGRLSKTIMAVSADAAFLAGLDAMTDAGVSVSTAKQGSYAPRELAGLPQCAGYRVRDLEKAMRRLVGAGAIKLENSGSRSRPRYQLVRVAGVNVQAAGTLE
jgi:RecA-family ATPase